MIHAIFSNSTERVEPQYGHSTLVGPVHFIPAAFKIAPQLEQFCGTLGITSEDIPLVSPGVYLVEYRVFVLDLRLPIFGPQPIYSPS